MMFYKLKRQIPRIPIAATSLWRRFLGWIWWRHHRQDGRLNIDDFGAVACDGSDIANSWDSAPAVRRAIRAATRAGGGTVFMTETVYFRDRQPPEQKD